MQDPLCKMAKILLLLKDFYNTPRPFLKNWHNALMVAHMGCIAVAASLEPVLLSSMAYESPLWPVYKYADPPKLLLLTQIVQPELPRPISRNSVESDHGCTSRTYFDKADDNVWDVV